jgi:hypothetical protein
VVDTCECGNEPSGSIKWLPEDLLAAPCSLLINKIFMYFNDQLSHTILTLY